MKTQQISIFIENRGGRLAEVTALLADRGINLRALSVADTSNYGVLRIIVDHPQAVIEILKSHGLTASVTTVLTVLVPDHPGALADVLGRLRQHGMDVEYMYTFFSGTDRAALVLRVADPDEAEKILTAAGYEGLKELPTE